MGKCEIAQRQPIVVKSENKIRNSKYVLIMVKFSLKVQKQLHSSRLVLLPMWSVNFYLTGKNNEKQVVPSPEYNRFQDIWMLV